MRLRDEEVVWKHVGQLDRRQVGHLFQFQIRRLSNMDLIKIPVPYRSALNGLGTLLVTSILLSLTMAENGSNHILMPLVLSMYEVTRDAVEMDWHFKKGEHWSLKVCELVYGPISDPEQLQVLSSFLPDTHSFKVTGLTFNVTYHLHMLCYSSTGIKLGSNSVQFTTGMNSASSSYPKQFISSMDSYRSHYERAISRNGLFSSSSSGSEDESYARTVVQSSSVILGAVCGIVGFLIINITVVMAVRRYSQRQIRRRRILQIEDRDYDDFPYLRGIE